ncbi:MAG: prepilin-type N-terminal cleavage/methylation domain-containing protein, partial [Elusimicrobiaceae bacterium]|nr:prepilin-type N-terminal cleavage/methylation domain-containing protein [Elusimicrobiaceae bacterium]
MKIRKRAFTLTELLVVVIVIGVLAAVVLPKFSKIMETRKTTEAEEVMSAIRTEQERRCALDKPYYDDINKLANILPNSDTKHYTYSLDTVGMMASSKGTYSYTLKMPSYLDGRICCEGAECDKLNKDYPTCTDLTQKADYEEETDCAATGIAPTPSCSGPSVETCGCNGAGTRSRTCDPDTGTWSDWSGCSAPEACECTDDEYEDCECGQRVHQCDVATGQWSGYDDSGCSAYQDGVQTETEPCDISGSKFRSRNVRHCGDVDSPKEILDDWTSWDMSNCEEKGEWKECPAGTPLANGAT